MSGDLIPPDVHQAWEDFKRGRGVAAAARPAPPAADPAEAEPAEEASLSPDCRLVLRALRRAPGRTMTNVELAALKGGAFAWRSRVSDLRFKHRYPISDASAVPGTRGVYSYTLSDDRPVEPEPETLF